MTSTRKGPVGGALVALAALLWARRRLLLVRVDGISMEPTYADGERILAVRADRGGRAARLRVGDVVVFDRDRPRVKRVAGLPGAVIGGATVPAGHVYVLGDRGRSYDSAVHGPVAASLVFGRAVRRFARPAPAGVPGRSGPAPATGPDHPDG